MKLFFTKLKICYHILFSTKHERVGQYICNRLITGEDLFYTTDFNLAHKMTKLSKDDPRSR